MTKELEEGFQKFKRKWNGFTFIQPGPSITKKYEKDFPFPLAADLWEIFLILMGKIEYSSSLKNTVKTVLDLVWLNPFYNQQDYTIEWENWSKTKLGLFIRYACIVERLESGNSINVKELSLMIGISSTAIAKKIKTEKIKAIKNDREWEIESKEAINIIKKYNK